MIRDLLLDNKEKQVDCPICCRQFVKEDGLYRHWDRHIGEILEPSKAEDPQSKSALPMCTLCCEVFPSIPDAWEHVVNFHTVIVNGRTKIHHIFISEEVPRLKKQKVEPEEVTFEVVSASSMTFTRFSRMLEAQQMLRHLLVRR